MVDLAAMKLRVRSPTVLTLLVVLSAYFLSFGFYRYDGIFFFAGLMCAALAIHLMPIKKASTWRIAQSVSWFALIGGAILAVGFALVIGSIWLFGNGAYQ